MNKIYPNTWKATTFPTFLMFRLLFSQQYPITNIFFCILSNIFVSRADIQNRNLREVLIKVLECSLKAFYLHSTQSKKHSYVCKGKPVTEILKTRWTDYFKEKYDLVEKVTSTILQSVCLAKSPFLSSFVLLYFDF